MAEKSLNDISFRSSIFDLSENEETAEDERTEKAFDLSKNQDNRINKNPEEVIGLSENQEIRVNDNLEEAIGVNPTENKKIAVRENTEVLNIPERITEFSYPVTKEGTTSKRKKYHKSVKQRKQENQEKKVQFFNVKQPCDNQCPKKCVESITNEVRLQINKGYVSVGNLEKKRFILANTMQAAPSKILKNATSSKSRTIQYFFQNETGERKQVCKIFFLTTLGYNKKNDRFVLQAISNSENHKTVKQDLRGKQIENNIN